MPLPRRVALLVPFALLMWSARRWLREVAPTVRVRLGPWIGDRVATVLPSVGALQRASVV
jgi:hypothetical protein